MKERTPGLQLLDATTTACLLVFSPTGPMYQPLSALAILAGLHAQEFYGICECYLEPEIQNGEYRMGVGLQFDSDTPDVNWWGTFVDNIQDACGDDENVQLNREGCELTDVETLRNRMVHTGSAGFEAGAAVWVSDPANVDPDSPFTAMCRNAQ